MSCELERSIVHGYLDGELDAVRAAEFERHLETCAQCVKELELHEALRASIMRAGLYERAPVSLRKKLREAIGARAEKGATPRIWDWRWLAAVAAIALIAAVTWFAVPMFRGMPPSSSGSPVTAAEIIDAHIRSLQPGHLTDVTSTDQHTVKPWFDGKLDFVPPVRDFTDKGFPLLGGRLDVLGGRNAAAIVYGRRKHLINVFVWPTKEADTPIHPPGSRQGFQWVHWRHQGMEFCAISDVSATDLHELAELLRQ